ncbi:NTP pyrophosphatase (non-canonical NTP hydrolase) [Clostridium acetobutylicum]|uniref:Uncharacterized protein, MazG family n=1 Tax=Clostridium acetobutylicum (strain ATCC 824 / DSM 792 / JCM 1419 / IAM 19013 / LMG 5710 / NBRC 13948 / NRRL B-527 / VKM B-1787 / 2291 / W) TaxID=272562 RepID=Q97HS8_CLOAB|nr:MULTISPECIES: MazG nucleotide pyrophosphohydrolase domain-containing protein [Clostridium]AAK79892.1 Uncharacterized protein, MazG family [Clostridium acetobutylicum ATCC 824]ADZ20982.1 Conserved hypothetical protein [Clostridium acetobutylicum EA 2018]AEI32069.1 hypothetical protein SMB_G1959 [Clostridium acetobutylicum DSM 1731]AWV79676.1 nucleotide pyrophosphohydrolase [Clostridium acetobutylicum]MBC2394348.1 nucleotide pyrophosphohydrolase [Clostridium acetobutylicum]
MKINELAKEAYSNAKAHGFWEDFERIQDVIDEIMYGKTKLSPSSIKTFKINAICTRLMLITGEVSEAMEGLRKNDLNNFKEELADVAIRLGDLCGGLGIDLEEEIKKKMEINKDRPYKHGKAF